ncbi:MAG: DUF308 domain-containing protein [Clostridiales bacterium]|nr:DUF308 domain-containing protein [Clostridiales bacterium]MBR6210122.1 DUF308 domain-containing protein [Clostridiales bacterium]
MNNALKSYKARIMIVDIVMLLLGVGFIIWQDDMLATLILVTGVLVAVAGLILVINFLLDKDKTAFDWTIMIIGVIILAGGILLAIFAGAVVNISVFIFAGLLVVYGIIDIFTSIAITRLTGGIWWVPLLLGLAATGLGIGIIILKTQGTDAVAIMTGIAFIVAAVGGIINAVQTFFGRKKVLAAAPASTDAKDDLTDH